MGLIHFSENTKQTAGYIGSMATVEGAAHMPIDDTIKLVCQAIITIGYVTYQIIYALRQHNRRRRREKTKEP